MIRAPETLLGRFQEKLREPSPPAPSGIELEARWSYRCAAAVLHCFRLADLQPLDPSLRHPDPGHLLFDDLMVVPGGREEMLRCLKPPVRREALERLGDRTRMLRSLERNPDAPQTEVQQVLASWLAKPAAEWRDQPYARLGSYLQVSEWLADLVPGIPRPDEVSRVLSRRSVLAPFEHLVDKHFIGRDTELDALRRYVGVASRGVVDVIRGRIGTARPILVVSGPGGVGKSALLGRFLLEYAREASEQNLPFAYLPFDDPSLRAEEPLTLVVEIVSQIERQFPSLEYPIRAARTRIEVYRERLESIGRRGGQRSSSKSRAQTLERETQDLYLATADLLREASSENRSTPQPAVLVLDTFEEVEYRTDESLQALWQFLESLQDRHPGLRLIVSGRAGISGGGMGNLRREPLLVGDLEKRDRVRLLTGLGVDDSSVAERVASQIGGNPLTLRLAARVLQSEEADKGGVRDITTRRWFALGVSQELIRGQLYNRILRHIHDPDVRKLAHPGMVLRRVTVPIIHDFLARECALEAPDQERALFLFAELKREHALVSTEGGDILRFRPEVRRPMLALLSRDRPTQAKAIHRAAVAYYRERLGSPADVAEYLYHSLVLDEDPPDQLMPQVPQEVGSLLASSIDELPPRGAAWLASVMSFKVDASVFEKASLAEWERYTGRRALRASLHAPKEALSLLAERHERTPGSVLYALEARLQLLVDDPLAAVETITEGLASMPVDVNAGRCVEMLWVAAQALRRLRRLQEADARLEEAERLAKRLEDPLPNVQVLVQRLELRGGAFKEQGREREALLGRLLEALASLSPDHALREPELVDHAIALIPSHFADGADLERLMMNTATLAKGPLEATTLAGLDAYRETWELEVDAGGRERAVL